MNLTLKDIARIERKARLNPKILEGMSEYEQASAAQAIVAMRDEEYEKDAWLWAKEQVWTKDEASNQVLPFPSDKEYVHDLFDALETCPLLAIPKSRRMFITWGITIFLTHRLRYRKHYAGFIQSSTEDKAAFVIDQRMAFIENTLAPIYRREYKANRTVQGKIGTMTYLQTGSYGKALAQGADAFRTYTPTFVFLDEVDFMEKGHESFVATLPFAEKKCQIVLVSTSNGPQGVIADMARSIGFVRF